MFINENLGITAPVGFLASGIHCGLKKNQSKNDLALIYSEVLANAAAVYTKNKVKGAPLIVTKNNLVDSQAQAIIINSGNANTCTGDDGFNKALVMTTYTAKNLDIKPTNVLVASTGVIGVPLDINKISLGIPHLTSSLSKKNFTSSAKAIMTTDTIIKQCAITTEIKGKKITIGAMAKGSGMIHPNMATMLSFITTDLSISKTLLQEALTESVNLSYNRISVDGDSSTNDMVIILANVLAKNPTISKKDKDYDEFVNALNLLNINLSKKIAKDGEGATKLIECTVENMLSEHDAEILSKSVVSSSLVKAAIFGSDANWGRILCALGYSDINFNPNSVDVSFISEAGSILVCENGLPVDFDEIFAKKILLENEIKILINMKIGFKSATTWGCDLTYDYVRINGDYRS